MKHLFLLLALLALLCACGNAATSSPQPTPTHRVQPTHAPAKPTATPRPKVQSVTHGTPRIGGLFSDFYGKYGTPHTQGIGNSQTWVESNGVFLNATPNGSGMTTGVSVIGNVDWSNTQTLAACDPFLPVGATKFNVAGNLTDYHSSIGEIVMQLTQGSCVLIIAPS